MSIRFRRTSFLLILLLLTAWMILSSRVGITDNLHIKAPEVVSETWLNGGPAKMADLRGKVVLVEFWTFGCSNCRNVEPYVKEWYRKYHNAGLEIISIHSPEFEYEQEVENVRHYISRQGIEYPVAIDNGFANWKRYNNRFWPTLYLIDKQGYVRHKKIGEGGYTATEQRIKTLLQKS